MSTEIFKVGDPVFDIRYGWGEVVLIDTDHGNMPIKVSINGDYYWYTEDGEHVFDSVKLLSFTEYDLISGGWSQDRSVLNQPKNGQLVYIKDGNEWKMRYFSHKVGDLNFTFDNQRQEGHVSSWHTMSVENPLLKEKE